ncbi:MAG TPA: M20/M25/M40 family metallo-hydrolase [Roseiflexaceae bacterium]|nr:M20/M25/M40 family metallo-hydrolase [Roseiflexaceae bacterium]
MRRVAVGAALLGAALAGLAGANRRSLAEGIAYLRGLRGWQPDAVVPVDRAGPFGVTHALVQADNAGRCRIVQEQLRAAGLEPLALPVAGDPLPNLLVRLGEGPYTLCVAHYDKSRETPAYQGACDNTASVAALLAAARELARRPPARALALLFTSGEERGLLGARAFVEWSSRERFPIAAVVNFDMVGRGRLAVRPSAQAGFFFWLPGLGHLVFDGRQLRRGAPYPLPDRALVARLHALMGDRLVEYQRFTAYSDSVLFQAAGLPTVSISSDDMAYLDRVWERDADRIELLDQRSLALARELVLRLGEAV